MVRLRGGGKNETALSITLSNAASRIIMRARRQGTKGTKEHEGFVCLKYSPLYNPLSPLAGEELKKLVTITFLDVF